MDKLLAPKPSLEECIRRADKLGMSYGNYMASEQHTADVGAGGYFEERGIAVNCKKKRRKKK